MQHDFILLDRSGSMSSQWNEALGAVNGYAHKLAEDKVKTNITLAVFDKQGEKADVSVIRDNVKPSKWKDISDVDATPRGMTPLNDAVGKIVSMAESKKYDKAVIIIMTDGQENASVEYTVQQAKDALERCRAKGWQVIFLGANFDNAIQAASYGNTLGSTAKAKDLKAALAVTASLRSDYGSRGVAMNYTTDMRNAMGDTK
jgi:Mg-chelatase subunit ChlD